MKTVINGNNVTLHYKGTFTNGEVFDDSRVRGTPMNIMVGKGNLIKGFENALLGMKEGEVKNINLTADEAYGQPVAEAIVSVPRTAFPQDFKFEEGILVSGTSPTGQPMHATIVSFTDAEVTLDHNHPLVGKDLNFEIEMIKIQDSETTK